MSQNKNLEPTPPSPEEKVLQLGSEVFDLRNQLLYERVGEEGMKALADRHTEKSLFDMLESETTTPESLALSSLFREQALDELSRELFDGRGFHELNNFQRQRVEQSQHELDQHKVGDNVGMAELKATGEKDQLDNELNRVFNTRLTGFLFDGSQHKPDELNLRANRLNMVHLGHFIAVPGASVKLVDGEAKGFATTTLVEPDTGYEIDLTKLAKDMDLSSDEMDELKEFQGYAGSMPLHKEQLEIIQEGLENTRAYLKDHLDPRTQSHRMGKYGPEKT
jgi:hypothetical protein